MPCCMPLLWFKGLGVCQADGCAVQTVTGAISAEVPYAFLTDYEVFIFLRVDPDIEMGKVMRWNLKYYVAYACHAEPGRATAFQAMYAFMKREPEDVPWSLKQMLKEAHPGCPLSVSM